MANGDWKALIPIATAAAVGGGKPLGEAAKAVIEAAIHGTEAVLGRICLPAAQEFGLALQDKVSVWRALNRISLMKKLEQSLDDNKIREGAHVHPRLVSTILEKSSWIDDSMVQDMWVGLLSSSCTETGDDDSNLLFTNLLGDLTKLQAKLR